MIIREQARIIAKELLQNDVNAGLSVDHIQSTYHAMGGPQYHAQVVAAGKIKVTKAGGVECLELFSLRKIYDECKSRQTTLFDLE